MKPLIAFAALILFASVCTAQQPGAAPTFKVVAKIDKERGQLVYAYTLVRYVNEQRQVFENVNGQQVAKVVTRQVAVMEIRNAVLPLADSRVITPDGKQLALDEVMNRLKTNDVFAIAGDSNTPNQVYLQALNASTLIVIPAPPMPLKK